MEGGKPVPAFQVNICKKHVKPKPLTFSIFDLPHLLRTHIVSYRKERKMKVTGATDQRMPFTRKLYVIENMEKGGSESWN